MRADFSCDADGSGNEDWFEWDRLLRRFPFTFATSEDALANYGFSVDVSGDIAVVGASRQAYFLSDDPDEPTVIQNAGAAFIFRFVNGEWVRVATIRPPLESITIPGKVPGFVGIRFGSAVAITGSPDNERVVIGAPFEPFLFIDDDTGDVTGGFPQAGAVYVYERVGPTWPTILPEENWQRMPARSKNFHAGIDGMTVIEEDRLWSNFPFEGSRFGSSVSILPFRETEEGWVGGDMVVGGAPTAVAFPNCEDADIPGWFSGTVTTFTLGGALPDGEEVTDEWVMGESLTSECFPFDQFGSNVTINYSYDRERPVILSGVSQGIAFEPDPKDPDEDLPVFNAGTVLMFEYDPPDDDDNGDGAMQHIATDDEEKEEEIEPSWKLRDVFQSPHPRPQELFGQSVALITSPIDNDAVVIGSRLSHASVDKNGDPVGGTEELAGAVFVFRRLFLSGAIMDDHDDEYEWDLEEKLISIDPQRFGWFGQSVDAFGNTIVVGAPREDMEDPDDPDALLQAVGFAYVFNHDGSTWDNGSLLMPYGPQIMNQFDQFGLSVAVDGGVIVVGAPGSNWTFTDDQGKETTLQSVGSAFTYGRCFDAEGPNSCFATSPDPGCDTPACANAVCVFDSTCCEVEWGQQCVDLAATQPGACGFPIENCPGAADCCAVDFDNAGCNDPECCEAVCAVDSFCCDVNWDECCVQLAEELCEICPQSPPAQSCEFFCGFDDIDGCGSSCDAMCIESGDCAPDACIHCAPEIPGCGMFPNSCVGYCGGVAPGGCSCTEDCEDFGDCCPDVCDHCGYFDDCQPEGAAPIPPVGDRRSPGQADHRSRPTDVHRPQGSLGSSSTAPNRR